ncbi:sulfotransferase [Paracoccus versutus]|uniref:sulfotransferase n=1 Tax=Paracoccus versutus TaxID=34007 RepID=UPI000DF78696|nr:sulfotransferase [Paracoccus versutus]MCJ1903412.1 sulfotransferase [Paracoccus versutus]RDD69384.1 sulfotransferase [Paracoccus versutus]
MAEKEEFFDLYRPKDGYVFLVTYGRSGSTLMSNYLNSFPGYCIRGENNNVIYHLCSAVLSLNEENFTLRRESRAQPVDDRNPAIKRIMETPKDPWYGAELVDPDRFAKTIFNDFVKEILSPPPETRVAGFKEIKWAHNLGRLKSNLDLIAKYFPKTRFIFQTRDAGTVAKSGWWVKRPVQEVERYIENADAAFLSYAKENDSCIHIRYEDLTEGDGAFRRLASFLGEDFCSDTAQRIIDSKLTHLKNSA